MRRKRYMTKKRKLKRKRLALLSVLSISMIGLGAGVLFLDNNSNLIGRLGANASCSGLTGNALTQCQRNQSSSSSSSNTNAVNVYLSQSSVTLGVSDSKTISVKASKNNIILNYVNCKKTSGSARIHVENGTGSVRLYTEPVVGDSKINETANFTCTIGYYPDNGNGAYSSKSVNLSARIKNYNDSSNKNNVDGTNSAKLECEKKGGTYKRNSAGKYQCVKQSTTTKPSTNNKNNVDGTDSARTECIKLGGTYKRNSAGKYQCVKTSTNNNNNNVNKNSSNTNNSSSSSNSSANNNTTIKE
ncbi:MAG: hypothetical protein J6J17_01280, partial [Bacilli bacterium]|nr:hypothetical protein [Bacilli bacterium]